MNIAFALYERYRTSFHYTRMVLSAAYLSGTHDRLRELIRDLFDYETEADVGPSLYFTDLINMLSTDLLVSDTSKTGELLQMADERFAANGTGFSTEMCQAYYDNRIRALQKLDRHQETLDFGRHLKTAYRSAAVLRGLCHACLNLRRYEKALDYGYAAMALGDDAACLLDLARARFGLGQYAEAMELLKNAIRFTGREREEAGRASGFRMESGLLAVNVRPAGYWDGLYVRCYRLLIQCCRNLGRSDEAKAVFHEMQKQVKAQEPMLDALLLVNAQNKLAHESDRVQQCYEALKAELSEKENALDRCIGDVRSWAGALLRLQSDVESEIGDQAWDAQFAERMDEVIRKIEDRLQLVSSKAYHDALSRVGDRFGGLPAEAKRFLASAEQMYAALRDNPMVDFAPIMVEYCKVIECALWAFLDRSEEYRTLMRQELGKPGVQRTLGAAVHIVKYAPEKPLAPHAQVLEKILSYRNDSAHINMNRVPNVAWVRSLIWDTDLLRAMLE